ncbi:MAG: hypothetical protein M5U12_05610 [Verrucomicrobia bacterium]|nr:hypothetical protein [Verrucomicrobiota bacterium]
MLRLNANGTLDTIFKTGPTEGALGPSLAAAPFLPFEVVSSGRIVAGGRFTKVQNSVRPNIVQLLPDGLRDPSFVPAGGPNNEVNALAVQPDGGILIAGPFTAVDGVARRGLARLHGNPSPPLLLASTTTPIGELADGLQATLEVKVIGNPPPQVTWYRGDIEVGTGAVLTLPKTDPANQGEYYAVVANGSGIIATDPVTLAFNTGPPVINGAPQDSLACLGGTAVFRVSATGAVPLSYQWKRNGEDLPGETGAVLRVLVGTLDPGKDSYTVAVSNPLAAVESAPVRIVLSQQGTLDRCFYEYTLPAGINDAFKECMPPTTFDFPSYEAVESIAWQPNGHVVIGGGAFTHGSQWSPRTRPFLMRFTEWGVRAYTGEERPDAAVHVVAAAPDSAVYLAGDFKHIVDEAGAPRHAQRWVAKFDANLRFVPGFAPALLPETAQVTALLVQPDGKLLMAGTFSNVNGRASLGIARLLPSGQSDPAFRSGIVFMNYAKPLALALQADGSILLGGQGAYYGAGTPPGVSTGTNFAA